MKVFEYNITKRHWTSWKRLIHSFFPNIRRVAAVGIVLEVQGVDRPICVGQNLGDTSDTPNQPWKSGLVQPIHSHKGWNFTIFYQLFDRVFPFYLGCWEQPCIWRTSWWTRGVLRYRIFLTTQHVRLRKPTPTFFWQGFGKFVSASCRN